MSEELERERKQATLEKILATARLARHRGQYADAWRALDDALALAPGSAEVMRMMGDLNLEQEEYEAAAQCFRRALELAPGDAAAEVGLAKASLALARLEPVRDPEALLVSAAMLERRAPDKVAALSLAVPGLGQMYLLEVTRGAVMLLVAFPLWYLVAMAVWDWTNPRGHWALSFLSVPAVALTLALHLWSAYDAHQVAQRLRQDEAQRL